MSLDLLVSSLYLVIRFLLAGVGPSFDGAGIMAYEQRYVLHEFRLMAGVIR